MTEPWHEDTVWVKGVIWQNFFSSSVNDIIKDGYPRRHEDVCYLTSIVGNGVTCRDMKEDATPLTITPKHSACRRTKATGTDWGWQYLPVIRGNS